MHKSAASTLKWQIHFFGRPERRNALTLAQLTGSTNLQGVSVGGNGSGPSESGVGVYGRTPVWDGGSGWWAAQDLNL